MRIAIMQPYLFPYIGYWQLIQAVDTFVIYDDVNYIKQGYINRNSILSNGESRYLTLEILGASSNRLINEIEVGGNSRKLLMLISECYKRAPFFSQIMPLLEKILLNEEKVLSKFVGYSIQEIANFLDLNTKILYSSQIEKNCNLKGQDKVINICERLNATVYINAVGGKALYDKKVFKDNGLDLRFVETRFSEYRQFSNEFLSHLSVIDVMMFNDLKTIYSFIEDYKLI